MTADRLSRQELSWLLAQVARGASKALREGVVHLQQPTVEDVREPNAATHPPETLDALDDAIDLLSQLHAPSGGKARYGRFDLAALLYDVAPDARIAMEPGAGTEVFGEETELRRMLHVLVNHTHASPVSAHGPVSPEVHIRREGDLVRVSVALGPDSSATREIERRWLTRMAIRLGGRLELEAGTQSLLLPADGASDRKEIAELRRELEQAQQLGEVYARELAAAFESGETPAPRPVQVDTSDRATRLELLVAVARASGASVHGWLDAIKHDHADLAAALGPDHELVQRILRRVHAAHDFLLELTRLSRLPLTETPARVDLTALVRDSIEQCHGRAARAQVKVEFVEQSAGTVKTRTEALRALLETLIDHAVAASPPLATVSVSVRPEPTAVHVSVCDAGPALPVALDTRLFEYSADPSAYGRPPGLWLLAAHCISRELGAELTFAECAGSGVEVRVRLSR